jgi:hypothetical protein
MRQWAIKDISDCIEKWDGRLPGIVGSGTAPFINVGGGK